MKKFLYYPNLEPPNQKWLKFAMLYLEKFESIVPFDRQNTVSDDYRNLTENSDLVEMFSPTYQQSSIASNKAIYQAERVLNSPFRNSEIFNRVNLKREWQSSINWDFQIYSGKFTSDFGIFCLDNKLGIENDDGLLLPKELAFLFMTCLAKQISFDRESSIITDNLEFDTYTNYSRVHRPEIVRQNNFMMGVLDLQMPMDISNISFDTLIKFRKENRKRIKSFNEQIENVEDSIGAGITENEFVESFKNAHQELASQISLLTTRASVIPLATYMLISNPTALTEEYARNILTALGVGLGGYYSVKKSLVDTQSRRSCKKYLANLSSLR